MTYKKIIKGTNTYYVSETDSYAVVADKLYIDGKLANDGSYTLNIDDGTQVAINVKGGVMV